MLPLLISLGFWQLDRATEKEQILTTLEEVKRLPGTRWEANGLESGRLVQATGYFDTDKYWLLDNRIHRGKVGFEVIMPFYTEGNIALVNRGWIEGDLSRRSLPELTTPSGELSIVGRVHIAMENALVDFQSSDGWPKLISSVHLEAMYNNLEQNRAITATDNIIRLQQDSQAALVSDWPAVNVLPQKHIAYAVQWFAMAFALFAMYIIYSSNILVVAGFNNDKSSNKKEAE
nr:SURF1 family protein [Pseudoteredinibacter isoporae]